MPRNLVSTTIVATSCTTFISVLNFGVLVSDLSVYRVEVAHWIIPNSIAVQICMDIGISWKLMRDGVEAVVDYMQRRFPEEDVEDIKRQAQRAIWKHILWVKGRKAVDFGNESSDEDDDEWEEDEDTA